MNKLQLMINHFLCRIRKNEKSFCTIAFQTGKFPNGNHKVVNKIRIFNFRIVFAYYQQVNQ